MSSTSIEETRRLIINDRNLKQDFESTANHPSNLQYVHNELEKPKGAFANGIYQDIEPDHTLVSTFNQYDATLKSAPKKPSFEQGINQPISKVGDFRGTEAYLYQPPTGGDGSKLRPLSITEAHEKLGSQMEHLFLEFADTGLECPTCTPHELEAVKNHIRGIATHGKLFLSGGVDPYTGAVLQGRVQLMKEVMDWTRDSLREFGRKGMELLPSPPYVRTPPRTGIEGAAAKQTLKSLPSTPSRGIDAMDVESLPSTPSRGIDVMDVERPKTPPPTQPVPPRLRIETALNC